MSSTSFDYLIVGQGLAGTILAHQLITKGQRVMVLDDDHRGSSSKVAAGIINPITGPRLARSNDYPEYYATAKAYYAKLEYHIKSQVFRSVKQVRKIQNDQQQEYLTKRLGDDNYQTHLTPLDHNNDSFFTDNSYPDIEINGTSIVDTKLLLEASKAWLLSLHSYQSTTVNYSDFIFNDSSVSYKNTTAQAVIFCEGYQAIQNPWLKHLPFKLAKGEIITLANNDQTNTMLSWDKWLVPFADSLKLGSNFAWNDLDLSPSRHVKEALIDSLTANINAFNHSNLEILAHEVGIRPSSHNREPFIGALPQIKNAYCFNGFGSKGCLLIPYYSQILSEHLLKRTPLPKRLTKCL